MNGKPGTGDARRRVGGLRRKNDRDLATTGLEGRGDAEARTSERDEDDENEEKSIVRASRGPVRLTIALGLGS